MVAGPRLGTIRAGLFVVYCVLAVLSGILALVGYQPPHVSDSLALLAATFGGTLILLGSVKSLINKEFTVDFLASIAVIVSIALGEYLAAAEAMFIMLVGEGLEGYAAQRTSKAITRFVEQMPRTARLIRDNLHLSVP